MNWEYQIARAPTVESFQDLLNKLGADGWEAISGAYAIGESKKVTLGQGMTPTMTAGAPLWVAIMKRALKT
jgi:hypothetical protein